MEIRFMKYNELQSVILLARGVYETCARNYVSSPAMVQQFYDYIDINSLSRQLLAGELYVWGALDGQLLCGVSAMQSGAHVTMLYVHPSYQRQGIGTQLLANMAEFAVNDLGARRITAHVIPAVCAPFFYHRGYAQMRGVHAELDMLPLEYIFTPLIKRENEPYPTKPVKAKTVVLLTIVFFLTASVISVAAALMALI